MSCPSEATSLGQSLDQTLTFTSTSGAASALFLWSEEPNSRPPYPSQSIPVE